MNDIICEISYGYSNGGNVLLDLDSPRHNADLETEKARFISNPHIERKEKQAWKNMELRRNSRSGIYWHRIWCVLLSKLRGHGNEFIGWSSFGREQYYKEILNRKLKSND